LQYFTRVQTEVEPTLVTDHKDLIVSVEEGPSGNFYFGAGFSSIDQLVGYIGMNQGNFDLFNPPYFTGGGQKLRLQATIGTKQENYEVIFVEPWLFNRHLAFEVDLFHRDLRYLSDLYSQRETGATLGLTRALFTDAFRVGLSYTIENVGIRIDPGRPGTNFFFSKGPLKWPSKRGFRPQFCPKWGKRAGDGWVSKVTFAS